VIDLREVIRAEVVARRVWVDLYPGENIHMLRWALS
jgi:hypothetical protein